MLNLLPERQRFLVVNLLNLLILAILDFLKKFVYIKISFNNPTELLNEYFFLLLRMNYPDPKGVGYSC